MLNVTRHAWRRRWRYWLGLALADLALCPLAATAGATHHVRPRPAPVRPPVQAATDVALINRRRRTP